MSPLWIRAGALTTVLFDGANRVTSPNCPCMYNETLSPSFDWFTSFSSLISFRRIKSRFNRRIEFTANTRDSN